MAAAESGSKPDREPLDTCREASEVGKNAHVQPYIFDKIGQNIPVERCRALDESKNSPRPCQSVNST